MLQHIIVLFYFTRSNFNLLFFFIILAELISVFLFCFIIIIHKLIQIQSLCDGRSHKETTPCHRNVHYVPIMILLWQLNDLSSRFPWKPGLSPLQRLVTDLILILLNSFSDLYFSAPSKLCKVESFHYTRVSVLC